MMRAMRVHELGAGLVMDEVPVPIPGPGQVRLKVNSCGVNFADTLIVRGRYQEKPSLPFAPGMEVCGTIDALGEGTTGLAIGGRVAANCGAGGFADFALAPASACVPVPAAMTDIQAAAFQVAYGTSHVALGHKANLQPGERLLVLGAAGGVGLTAVEVGKLLGAEVIAVARGADRLAQARVMGADHLIDSETTDIRDSVKALGGADVVYDPVGGDHWQAAIRAANAGARLIPIGFASGKIPQIPANILLVKNLTVIGFYWGGYARFRPEVIASSMRTLLGWFEAGLVNPHISHVVLLSDANRALELLETRQATGKVVVTM
jgi:NADPH2:quinone reductase